MPEHIVDRTEVSDVLATLHLQGERLVFAMPEGSRSVRIVTIVEGKFSGGQASGIHPSGAPRED